jgi:hypothetical protein
MIRVGSIGKRNGPLEALAWLFGLVGLVWFGVNWVLSGDVEAQKLTVVVIAATIIGLATLRNWRVGLYLFPVWLAVEDFARKSLGNNMLVYFGKDALVLVIYVAFFYWLSHRAVKIWKPPFLMPLLFLAGWAVLEAFNPLSVSLSYGLLGLKLYFYYVPLMFATHYLVRTDLHLRRFLVFNIALGGFVSLLGVIQAITGQSFLNPEVAGEDLVLYWNRSAPVSGLVFTRANSLFVSDGRFGAYLIQMWILCFGTVAYLVLRGGRGRKLAYLCAAAILAAILLSGVRTALVYSLISTVAMIVALAWGAPLTQEQRLRAFRAIRRFVVLSVSGGICVALLFPAVLASRWAFYMETLSPNSPATELAARAWGYPISEFLKTFTLENWAWGRGLGTASLGTQYVMRLIHAPPPGTAVENGYGALLLEMGIPGLLLWIVLSFSITQACWKVAKRLRGTQMFPLAFCIFWFAFIVLFPLSFIGLTTYQDFIVNAYLWMFIGILFRLPSIVADWTTHNIPSQGAVMAYPKAS